MIGKSTISLKDLEEYNKLDEGSLNQITIKGRTNLKLNDLFCRYLPKRYVKTSQSL